MLGGVQWDNRCYRCGLCTVYYRDSLGTYSKTVLLGTVYLILIFLKKKKERSRIEWGGIGSFVFGDRVCACNAVLLFCLWEGGHSELIICDKMYCKCVIWMP